MSEDIDVNEIDKYIPQGDESESKKKRKSKGLEAPVPESLSKLSGDEVLRILDFLHRKYLSWLTEAEGAKYSSIYKSAKEEALKEVLDLQAELQKQIQSQIEQLEKISASLQERISAPMPKISLLDDPRIRALIYLAFETIASKNPELQKYKPIAQAILLPEAQEQHE